MKLEILCALHPHLKLARAAGATGTNGAVSPRSDPLVNNLMNPISATIDPFLLWARVDVWKLCSRCSNLHPFFPSEASSKGLTVIVIKRLVLEEGLPLHLDRSLEGVTR